MKIHTHTHRLLSLFSQTAVSSSSISIVPAASCTLPLDLAMFARTHHNARYVGDLFSTLYYIENFFWSLADTDKLSYTLVTFRAAVEYIRGKEVEKWLPKTQTTSSVSYMYSVYSG